MKEGGLGINSTQSFLGTKEHARGTKSAILDCLVKHCLVVTFPRGSLLPDIFSALSYHSSYLTSFRPK